MTMRTCDKNCIANVDGKCAVQRCCEPITRLGGARLTDLKPCYGKCERCVWKYNGGCSEWNRRAKKSGMACRAKLLVEKI